MVAHRTLTPFVRVRILLPLPRERPSSRMGVFCIGFMIRTLTNLSFPCVCPCKHGRASGDIGARSAEGALRVRILLPLPEKGSSIWMGLFHLYRISMFFGFFTAGAICLHDDCWLSPQSSCPCRKTENPAFHSGKAML